MKGCSWSSGYGLQRDNGSECGYVLSELVRPSAVTESVAFSNNRIVLIRNDFLQVVDIDLGYETVHFGDKIQFEDKILAGGLLQSQLGSALVVVCGNVLWLVYLDDEKWIVEEIVSIDGKGQQQSIDFKAFVECDHVLSRYFVSLQYQGTIQIYFPPNGDWFDQKFNLEYTKKKGKRATGNSWGFKTISIGSIVVVAMAILNNDTLALLYRDFNFQYSMRYYSINCYNQTMVLKKQFEEFDEPPASIIPLPFGGVLVVSSLRLFYFPNDDSKSLQLNNFDDTISINNHLQVITKDISSFVSMDEILNTFEVIDDSRIMIISQSGLVYLINFDAKVSKKVISVNDFNIIPLNMATIPVNVHHISESYFFATSRISQSVLFQVIPKDPYITIVHSMESSPPILDLGYQYQQNLLQILSCQGGYHSGEFKKYSQRKANLSLTNTIPVQRSQKLLLTDENIVASINSTGLELINLECESTTTIASDRTYLDYKFIENNHYIVTTDGIYVNESLIIEIKIQFAQILPNGLFTFIDHDNNLKIFDKTEELQSIKINIKNITSLTCVSTKNILILVTNWHGEYLLFSLTNSCLKLAHESCLPGKEGILCGGMLLHENLLFVVLLSEAGITQFSLDMKTYTLIQKKTNNSRLSSLPMKISSSKKHLILFTDREVFGVTFDTLLKMLITFKVDETKQRVSDILVNQTQLIVLLNNELIQVMNLTVPNRIPYSLSTVYSTDLNFKLLNLDNTVYSVVISKELAIEDSKPLMKSKLRLVNTRKMKTIHTCNAPSGANMMDLCLIPNLNDMNESSEIQASFVVLTNGLDSPLLTFKIEKSKIVCVDESQIIGLENVGNLIDFETISAYDMENSSYFISGTSNFLVNLEIIDNSTKWTIESSSTTSSSTYTVGHLIVNKDIFAADLRLGLYEIAKIPLTDLNQKKFVIKPIQIEYDHQFISSIANAPDNHSQVSLIVGDLLGNVSIIRKQNSEYSQPVAFNIGDQVNVVRQLQPNPAFHDNVIPLALVGTVNGGIYLINTINIDDYEILQRCQNELDGLSIRNNNENRSWKLLSKDANGKPNRLPAKEIIDLRVIEQFLLHQESSSSLKKLKLCNKNQGLLERVYFDTQLF